MKELLCYVLFIIPIPLVVGFLISAVAYVPAHRLLGRCSVKAGATAMPYLELFTGIGGAIASLLLFRILELHSKMICAIILAVWAFLYFAWAKGSLARWLGWLAGFLVGWFSLAKVLIP